MVPLAVSLAWLTLGGSGETGAGSGGGIESAGVSTRAIGHCYTEPPHTRAERRHAEDR